jgi:hypothetical protein
MSSPELPELALREYDARRIANEVLWPLVEYFWHDDWRTASAVGQSMHIDRRGIWKQNEEVDVTLAALKHFEHDDDGEIMGKNAISTVNFHIETVVTDKRRTFIRDLMQTELEGIFDALAPENDLAQALTEGDLVVIEDEDLDDYAFKISTAYSLDTAGGVEVESHRLIEDAEGEFMWNDFGENDDELSQQDDDDMEDNDEDDSAEEKTKLFTHDMSVLECGLYVINAPEAIHKAFDSIRRHPVLSGAQRGN